MTARLDETITDAALEADVVSTERVAAPHLFLVLDCAKPYSGAARHCLLNIDEVIIGRGPRRSSRRVWSEGVRQLVLQVPDAHVSARHARLRRHETTWTFEDCGSRNGSRLRGEWLSTGTLADGDLLEVGHTFFIFRSQIVTHARAMADLEATQLHAGDPVFKTLIPALDDAFQDLSRVSQSSLSILLLGETGSGKELLARAIHKLSGRQGPFVAINCGALPSSLLEGQLFGHVKGAFSGAVHDAVGLIRAAHGGTLFLDEIGDLPFESQATLLRVLEENEVVPVGATRAIPVDVRVISATHTRIDQHIVQGNFRNDLFARLSGYRFLLPGLRDRIEDLGLFLCKVLADFSNGHANPRLSPDAARALFYYDWPRNIRELKHCMVAALVLSDGAPIREAHVKQALLGNAPSAPLARPQDPAVTVLESRTTRPGFARDEQLKDDLQRCLAECNGNISEVARRMGKARAQIHRWTRRLVIDPGKYRRSS